MGDGSGSPLDRRSPVQIAAHAIVDRFHRERVVQSLNLVGMTNSADRSNVDFEVVSRWEAETTIAQVTVLVLPKTNLVRIKEQQHIFAICNIASDINMQVARR